MKMKDPFLEVSNQVNGQSVADQNALQKDLLKRLMRGATALLTGRTREETLRIILESVQNNGFDRVRLFLLSSDKTMLTGIAQVGLRDENFKGVAWPAAEDDHFQEILKSPLPRIFPQDPSTPDPQKDRFEKHDVEQWATIPLILHDQVVGQLVADNKFSGRVIDEAELEPLTLFGLQAAAAIEKATLTAQDERKLEFLAQLARATKEIIGEIGQRRLTDLLTLIAKNVCEILTAEVCSVFICKDNDQLTLEAGYGYPEGSFQYGLSIPIQKKIQGGLTGYAAYEGKLINLHGDQLRDHPAILHYKNNFTPSGECHSVLALPLKQYQNPENLLIGLLRVDNKKDEHGASSSGIAFTTEDEWIIQIFAEIIDVCLECAKLVDQKKLMVENLPLATVAADVKGRVTEFNQEAERILGYSASEVIGQEVNILYEDEEEPQQIGAALNANPKGKLRGHTTRIRSKSGQTIPISLSAYWLNDHQQRRGSVGIFEDLRELDDYKEQLELTLGAIRTVAEAENLQDGLQHLAELLVARFPGTICDILLLNEGNDLLEEQAYATKPSMDRPSSRNRRINIHDYQGLSDLLHKGRPAWLQASTDPTTRLSLDKLNQDLSLDSPIHSLLVLPIKLGNRVLGILALGESSPVEQSLFSKRRHKNTELATAIATQSAIFIDRIRVADRGRSQLLSFYKASQNLLAQKDPERLLQDILNETINAAGASSVDLVLIDEEEREESTFSLPERPAGKRLNIRPEGKSMEVFRTGVAKHYNHSSQHAQNFNPQLFAQAKAAICLPLSLPYRRIGVMWLRYDNPRQFTEQEIVALQLYVNQAAMAYENAQEEERQKCLHIVAAELADQTDTQKARRHIVVLARDLLKADGVILGIYDTRTNGFISRFSEAEGIDLQDWELYRGRGPEEQLTARQLMDLGHPQFISDIDSNAENSIFDSLTFRLLKKNDFKSFLSVPLILGSECLGLLCVLYKERRGFNERDFRTANSFARYSTLALNKAKLFEQVNKTNEAATAVARVTALGQRLTTLEAIVRESREISDCDAVVLFEYDSEKKRLLTPLVSGLNFPDRAITPQEEKDYPLVLDILNSDEPFRIAQVTEDSTYHNLRFANEEKIASFVAFRLQAADRRVGVLFLNYRTKRSFTTEELQTIQIFASQAAVAIHYAQSTEANERKLRELAALEKLSERLQQSQNLQEMMDYTTERATKMLGTEYCNIILPDKDGSLRLHGQHGWNPPLKPFTLKSGAGSQTGYTIQTRQPVMVEDYAVEKRFEVMEHLVERGVRSSLSVPLIRGDRVIGALITFTTGLHHFSEEDVRIFQLIAHHAAMAILGEERFENLRRREKHLRAAHNSSRAILNRFGDEQKVLDEIVKEAVESVTSVDEPRPLMGTLQLYDPDRNELKIRSIYPEESRGLLENRVDDGCWSLDPHKAKNGRIGVTGRTIQLGHSQLVADLRDDPDYIEYNSLALSELSVPLIDDGKIMGAINVESNLIHGFDENDRIALEALADHAVIALKIARTHNVLRETKGLVGTRTALAWMGMANNEWRHTIAGEAAELANRITLLREYLGHAAIVDDRISYHLEQMVLRTKSIQERPITSPLSSEEGVTLINLNELVTERVRQLSTTNRYGNVQLTARTEMGMPLLVNVSSEWLRRAIDILILNSIRAVSLVSKQDPTRCKVTVVTSLNNQKVELRVIDCGLGIPDRVREILFIGKIEGTKGHGVGLLIAQAIVETYGGKISIARTGSLGTEMLIELPHHSREE